MFAVILIGALFAYFSSFKKESLELRKDIDELERNVHFLNERYEGLLKDYTNYKQKRRH